MRPVFDEHSSVSVWIEDPMSRGSVSGSHFRERFHIEQQGSTGTLAAPRVRQLMNAYHCVYGLMILEPGCVSGRCRLDCLLPLY